MKRKPAEAQEDGCALWVVTFGDAMSLLVTFFVMLVSFASYEESALMDLVGAMKGGLRVSPVPMATSVGGVPPEGHLAVAEQLSSVPLVGPDDAVQGANSMQEPGARMYPVDTSDYFLQLLDNGVSLVIRSGAAFESGTARIHRPDSEVWRVAAGLMKMVRSEVRIVARLPKGTAVRLKTFSTAWGLGIEQSLAVQQFVADRFDVYPGQISTAVQVVGSMAPGESADGAIEILYIGMDFLQFSEIPKYILEGSWRDSPPDGEAR